ncbi:MULTISPECIES: DUF998 domain-containing protein [unclassified Streptomyces]|uniref:DUF998 domain-containing protein n=1 Tax=unclassified Streptomyces TaxID=2593676 RepID=UPI0004C4B4E2|nr:DUF998 domain-containing protein [Streptomyces sp. NRRL F-2747]
MTVLPPATTRHHTAARIGGLVWLASAVQTASVSAVAAVRLHSLDLARDMVSTLGAADCGAMKGRWVCSPLSTTVNLSWALAGVGLGAGVLLVRPLLRPGRRRSLAVALVLLAAAGTVLVAASPYDARPVPHYAGAFVALLCGNLAVAVLAPLLSGTGALPRWWGRCGRAIGCLGLAAGVCFGTGLHAHAFQGGFERMAIWPLVLWVLASGLRLARHRG